MKATPEEFKILQEKVRQRCGTSPETIREREEYFSKPVIAVTIKPPIENQPDQKKNVDHTTKYKSESEKWRDIAYEKHDMRCFEVEKYWLDEREGRYIRPSFGKEYWREKWVDETKQKREQGEAKKFTDKTKDELLQRTQENLTDIEWILRVLMIKFPAFSVAEPEEILDKVPYFRKPWVGEDFPL